LIYNARMREVNLSDLVHPSDKQKEAFKAVDKYKYLLYGGAKFGGKSYFLRWVLVKLLVKWAYQGFRNVRVALCCEDYPALKDRQITKIKKEFPQWLGDLQNNVIEGLSFILKPEFGGGIIALRNLDDPSKYSSAEFAAIAIDELQRNPEEVFSEMRSIIRWPGITDVKFIASAMPGGIGHNFVKKIWIDRDFPPEELEKDQFHWVRALAYDNPYLSDSYLNQLKALPEKKRKAYLEGNWDIFAGQYFDEWRSDRHTMPAFSIPNTWLKYRSYDHGRDNPACCKWYAVDYDGRVWVYRELYQAGWNVPEIAAKIKELSENEEYQWSVADSSIFDQTGQGESIAQMFARQGIGFIPANKRRIDGWTLMHQYLACDTEKAPKMIYFTNCLDSIRTIPSLIHDDKVVEDLDTDGDDHCLAGETRIDTFWGKRKIKNLIGKKVYVNTLEGFRKCKSIRKTRKAKVWKIILSNNKIIKTTADHLFLTTNGWKMLKDIDKRYDLLIEWDICIKSYLKLFKNLIVNGIIYVVVFSKEMVKDYILLFGNIIKGKYLKNFTFTTKMAIERIIISRIWKNLRPINICHFTRERQKQKEDPEKVLKKQDHSQFYGINQKQAENGIVNIQKKLLRNGNGLKKIVLFAEKVIQRLNNLLLGQSIVVSIVELLPCGEKEVYNLTVPRIEHFTIENGIVVHNCADCDRYFLMGLREQKLQTPIEKQHISEVEKQLKLLKEEQEKIDFNEFYA